MPIPAPQITEIGPKASTAVAIDNDLIDSRNKDDSYGRHCNVDGKALITIATLQAFIEQGVPMDSDRLEGSYRWLLTNSKSCTSVAPFLLRANAAIATGNNNYEEKKADISSLRDFVKGLSVNNYGANHIPGFLLAIECLATFNEIDQQLNDIVKEKISILLSSPLISPAELAYSVQIAIDLELSNLEEISNALESIMQRYDRNSKLWNGCYAETAYVILDLSYIHVRHPIPRDLQDIVMSSIDELIKDYYKSKAVPELKNIPSEIGNNANDQKIYLNALILRAIVRSSIFFSEQTTFSLKFAHGYLRETYRIYDDVSHTLKTKELLIRIGFPVAIIAGIVFGGAVTYSIIKGWSVLNQGISLTSALIGIGTWIATFRKGKKND